MAPLAGHGLPPWRYVITNQKGGQGNTTTAAGVGAEAAADGYRLAGCDPRYASLTYRFPPQWADAPADQHYDLSHALFGHVCLDQATWPTVVPGLFIVPSFKTVTQFESGRR
jgi:chromosome partitioning protein